MNHSIRQHYLHVEVNGTESDALALQNRLSGVCQDWLLPALERAFDRCVPAQENWSIERLDIDAGILTIDRLEQDLAERVAQAIEKSLLTQAPSGITPSPISLSGYSEQKTTLQNRDDVLVYFLKTGCLPWAFRLPEGKNLEQTILDSWQETTKSGADLRFTEAAVLDTLASETARKRLTYQFSPVFIETLLARIAPEGKLASLLEHHWPEASKKVPANRSNNTEPIPPALPVSKKDLINTGDQPERPEKSEANTGDHPDIKEGIYIDHAGLVLLHPFLPQFFEALGVAEENKLLQTDRALCLLHFLATGQHVAPEYELILPKILCNIPPLALVAANEELTTAELEEAAALLEAVIRHWEVLQNTSIDGLRGTFLVRPGKISLRDDDDWLLQIESKSYDILLDQLPWGIGMIKLPWMEKMLWVEWG